MKTWYCSLTIVSVIASVSILSGQNIGIGITDPYNRVDIYSEGTTDTTETVLALISDISQRPVLQFSEYYPATPYSGMSIEYEGYNLFGFFNKLHIRGVDAQRRFTFLSGGRMGIKTENPNEELEVGGLGRIFIGDGGDTARTGLLIDANEPGDYVRLHPYDYGTNSNLDLYIPSPVGLGTSNPDTNAILHIHSFNKGIIVPRMNESNRLDIVNPSPGLLVYQLDGTRGFWFYDYAVGSWMRLNRESVMSDSDTDTKIQLEKFPDEDIIRFYTDTVERWRMTSTRLEEANTGNSVFIGKDAGLNDDLTDNRNSFIGSFSGISNTSGFYNTALGSSSLYSNTTGTLNTALGAASLAYNTIGTSNTAVGYYALIANTTGSNNTATGVSSLAQNKTGSSNSAYGAQSMRNQREGQGNSAFGTYAMYSDTAGYYNTAVGSNAMYSNVTGSYNIAIGREALYSSDSINGVIAIGNDALYHNGLGAVDFEGWFNTAVGTAALKENTTGQSNSALGDQSLQLNTTGLNNTATGKSALYNNTTGQNNTASGAYSLLNNLDADFNVAVGSSAMFNNSTGPGNTALGASSLTGNTTGSYNTAVGFGANVGSGNLTNATAVGAFTSVTASNAVILGNNANVGSGLSAPGNKLDVRSTAAAGSADIVLGLMSPVSKRPVLQFSEFDNANGNSGMSLEYDGNTTNRLFIRSSAPARLVTFTNNGDVGIGTELPNEELEVAGNGRVFIGDGGGANRTGLLIDGNEGGTYARIVPYDYGSGTNMDLYLPSDVGIGTSAPAYPLEVNGAAAKPGGGSWTNTSDVRLKQNIRDYKEGLEKILSIHPVRYQYNETSGYDTTKEYVGVIAQELQEVAPGMVSNFNKNGTEYLAVDNSEMTYMLINAIKEQQQIIAELQNQVSQLQQVVGQIRE